MSAKRGFASPPSPSGFLLIIDAKTRLGIIYTGRELFTLAGNYLHWQGIIYTGRELFTLAGNYLHSIEVQETNG